MKVEITNSEILYECERMGYTIEIEEEGDSQHAYFCSRFWVDKKVFAQSYSMEWGHQEIKRDLIQKLLQRAGLVVRAKVEYRI